MGMPIAVYLPRFYSEGMGLSLATVGLIFTLARIWDVVTDPLPESRLIVFLHDGEDETLDCSVNSTAHDLGLDGFYANQNQFHQLTSPSG